MDHIIGNVTSAVQRHENPKAAPACAYVPMPDGSSSEAPVTRPGPRTKKNRVIGFFSRPTRVSKDSADSLRPGMCEAFEDRGLRARELLRDFGRVMYTCPDPAS